MRRDKKDDIFSKCVRERTNYTCEKCGKYYPEGQRMGLHCSHLFGRLHRSTRWSPDNCFAHCYSCHQYLGSNPVEFYMWAEEKLGSGTIELLRERHLQIRKWTKPELEELYQHYKSEHEKMREKRKNGETGRIEFLAYE